MNHNDKEEVHDLKTKIPLKDLLKSMSFISMNIWFVVVNLRCVSNFFKFSNFRFWNIGEIFWVKPNKACFLYFECEQLADGSEQSDSPILRNWPLLRNGAERTWFRVWGTLIIILNIKIVHFFLKNWKFPTFVSKFHP